MTVRGIAHRGYPVKYPENTLTSFKAAYELGFTHVELDVHLSKDGVPVIMHDHTIDRMTNAEGYVKDYTLEQLKQFRVQEKETIPTLEEALTFAKDKMIVGVELKQKDDLYPGLEQTVLDVIQKAGMLNNVYVNSFDHNSVAKVRKLSAEIELGLIYNGAPPDDFSFIQEINAASLAIRIEYITDEYVQLCTEQGRQIIAWPINTQEDMEKVSRYPTMISTTDRLEDFKAFFEKVN